MLKERERIDYQAERDVDLRRHWEAITTHWWLPLAGLVIGVIVGYLVSVGGSQVYSAKAVVYLGQPLSIGGVPLQSQSTNPSTIRTLVTAESTIQSVARKVGLRPDQLRGRISTQAISGAVTRLNQNPNVSIAVTGHYRGKVAAAANQLANVVVTSLGADYSTPKSKALEVQINSQKASLEALNKNIAALQATLAGGGLSSTDRLIVASQLNGLEQQRLSTTQALTSNQQGLLIAQNIEAPQVLTHAVATKTTARSRRNTLLVAGLIGLILGTIAAVLYEPARRRAVRRPA